MRKLYRNLAVAAITCSVIVSCERHSIYSPDREEEKTIEYFDFSTSQAVDLGLAYDVPEGYRVSFDVYDKNPMIEQAGEMVLGSDLKPIASGVTNGYGKYDLEKIIPAYVKEFYVYSSNRFAPTLLQGKIENGGVSLAQVDLSSLLPDRRTSSLSTKGTTNWMTLGDWNWCGRPDYLSDKKVEISASALRNIEKNFPDKKKVNPVYFDKTDLYVAEDAQIWLTVLSSEGSYNNSLGYYCYTGEPEAIKKDELVKVVAFPKAKIYDSFWLPNHLHQGEAVQLKYWNADLNKFEETFPKGTRIGWVLLADAFEDHGLIWKAGTMDYNKPTYFSHAAWNPEISQDKNHMVLFKTQNNGQDFVAFGFEDKNNGEGDQDCNDVMFHVFADPANSITNEIPEIPVDPDDDIVKKEVYSGTLAFEDLWPRQGDYDLNDLVIRYHSTATCLIKSDEENESYGKVTGVKDEFMLTWSGAVYNNAFGYQMNIDQSNVKSIKIMRGDAELSSESVIDNRNPLTIMLFDAALTEVGVSSGKTMRYSVEIEFNEPLPMANFNEALSHAPYNPFIVVSGGREAGRKEVHLPMYQPTEKNNNDLLGTADDKSSEILGRYYVSDINQYLYPFALHILGDIDFINKAEAVRIDLTYPEFAKWVESKGTEFEDWYKHPVGE